MDVVSLYKRAWAEVSDDLASWIVIYLVFMMVSLFTGGLGVVLMPNLHRELRDARAENRGPEVARLFQFDQIGDDAVAGIVYLAALTLGSLAAGIGTSIAALALAFLMPLAADNRYEPIDNAKLSAQHVLGHLVPHALLLSASVVLAMVGIFTCGLGFLIAGPLMGMAVQLYYEDSRQEIDDLAATMGLRARIAGPTADTADTADTDGMQP